MPVALALPVFALSLLVTLAAARLFARRLDLLGVVFGFPEAAVGLLTALAADGPEISSALIALAGGQQAVSSGVVVGSNVFNLAAMIGLSALLAGRIRIARPVLAIEGTVAVLVLLLAAGVLLGALSAGVAAGALLLLAAAYLLVLFRGHHHAWRLPLPRRLRGGLAHALASTARQRDSHSSGPVNHRRQVLMIASDVALILLGSAGMVESAVALGGHWGVSATAIGVLVLGPLTSVPNAQTAVRLGLMRRGAALVSETFASNTINLVGGVLLPALFVALASETRLEKANLAVLALMTLVCIAGLARAGGMSRRWGAALCLLYAAFVGLQLAA
jgi:cation:H+ antiporter